MKKYKVSISYTDYLDEVEIEAADEDEAFERYRTMWAAGEIDVVDGEITGEHIEEVKEQEA